MKIEFDSRYVKSGLGIALFFASIWGGAWFLSGWLPTWMDVPMFTTIFVLALLGLFGSLVPWSPKKQGD